MTGSRSTPINPITLQKYREAFVTSRAKDDTRDACFLAELLLSHCDKLTAWAPEDSSALELALPHGAGGTVLTASWTPGGPRPRAAGDGFSGRRTERADRLVPWTRRSRRC